MGALALVLACGVDHKNGDGGPDSGADAGTPDGSMFIDAGPCVTTGPCPLVSGQDVYVDGAAGADGPCCCGSLSRPCETLTHTLSLLADAGALGTVVHAYNSDGTAFWRAPEAWPILLSMGVTLRAPGVAFVPDAGYDTWLEAFAVLSTAGGDDGGITIEGDPSDETEPRRSIR